MSKAQQAMYTQCQRMTVDSFGNICQCSISKDERTKNGRTFQQCTTMGKPASLLPPFKPRNAGQRYILEKCIFRPLLQKAWDTIRSTASDGDKAAAWKTINMHKIDNANMMCGRLVQDHCDRVILGDQTISESVSKMFADLHEWEPPANHPAVEKQLAIRTHREAVRYTDEGRRPTKRGRQQMLQRWSLWPLMLSLGCARR